MSVEETGFGLVMPFVTCQSNGGPHEDNAYVAGFEAGIVDMTLGAMPEDTWTPPLPLHEDNRPMIDLIAMRNGFVVDFGEAVDGWIPASFRRVGDEVRP